YVNGTLSLSATNSTSLGTTGTSGLFLGWVSPNAGNSLVMYIDDVYVDSGNDNSDTGDVHVTAKLPIADGFKNGFTVNGTASGTACTAGSTNHCQYVNERVLNITNFLSGAAKVASEEATLQG